MRHLALLVAVIDDDESIRDSLSSLLRSHGFAVQTFKTADDFLSSAAVEAACCIVSDIQMPGKDGFGLAEAYHDRGGRSQIIFITAFYDKDLSARARAAGVSVILKKPFDGQPLVEAIRAACGMT